VVSCPKVHLSCGSAVLTVECINLSLTVTPGYIFTMHITQQLNPPTSEISWQLGQQHNTS